MATKAQINDLRLKVDIQSNDPPYTDEFMAQMIDAGGVFKAASDIWMLKAAEAADFVDTAESGSSRKMSQLADNALRMAQAMKAEDEAENGLAGRSFTVRSERI